MRELFKIIGLPNSSNLISFSFSNSTKAQTAYATLSTVQGSTNHSFAWTSSWDDKSYACYVLGAKLFGDTVGNLTFALDAQRNLDWWTVGVGSSKVTYSPGGQAWLDTWGSTRYASVSVLFLYSVIFDYFTYISF
jgi:endoglucanase